MAPVFPVRPANANVNVLRVNDCYILSQHDALLVPPQLTGKEDAPVAPVFPVKPVNACEQGLW